MSQRELLSLIRNFAAEKSEGERRVVSLRKQIEKLARELNESNAELENAKRCKEMAEQDLKGFEVQLMLVEASAQTLEARVSLIHDQISDVGSDLETLKSEAAALRDQFFHTMLHLNATIRKFQESVITCDMEALDSTASRDVPQMTVKENDAEVALRALENTLLEVISQTAKVDEEYQAEQQNYKNSSKLEATYSSLGEELQRRCMCPSCHVDNLESFSELLANLEK
ncbi:hypothetical protein Fmac_010922 [Flemingia macrophylla]|uniref:Uncharacterized protein n=1 Tax=Flemingia macrophylla TaxID=520843 RepID=A0ABD1MKZ6_9FABA